MYVENYDLLSHSKTFTEAKYITNERIGNLVQKGGWESASPILNT